MQIETYNANDCKYAQIALVIDCLCVAACVSYIWIIHQNQNSAEKLALIATTLISIKYSGWPADVHAGNPFVDGLGLDLYECLMSRAAQSPFQLLGDMTMQN